jgi:hypothetical protein
MLRTTATLLTIVAGLALSGQAFAQASDSEATTATISLADPIALTETTSLRFGSVLKGDTGSNTVTIDASTGDRTLGGAGNAALVSVGTVGRAAYSVSGEDDATFSISLSNNPTAITNGGTGSLGLALARSATTGTLTGGSAIFGVGGVVTIDNTDSDDGAGAYSANFEVTVAYN